jgi:hypothetical protein
MQFGGHTESTSESNDAESPTSETELEQTYSGPVQLLITNTDAIPVSNRIIMYFIQFH